MPTATPKRAGAREGPNDFGQAGWGGPCPPRGSDPHRYVFTLLALSDPARRRNRLVADAMKGAAEGKILGHDARSR